MNLLHRALDRLLLSRLVDNRLPEDRGQIITNDEGSTYLARLYVVRVLRERGVPALFLHRFCRSDLDRELHNHPWRWAVAVVLTNGYTEERMEGAGATVTFRRLGPLSVNVIRASTYHKVTLFDEAEGTWTLFIAGPRSDSGSWGFLDKDTLEFEDWRERDARLGKRWNVQVDHATGVVHVEDKEWT